MILYNLVFYWFLKKYLTISSIGLIKFVAVPVRILRVPFIWSYTYAPVTGQIAAIYHSEIIGNIGAFTGKHFVVSKSF